MSHLRTRSGNMLLGGLLLAAGLGTTLAPPADAAILDTDRPKITGEADFGRNWDTIAAPRTGGYLYWDVTNGQVRPDLEGYLYMKNMAGDCAKVQVIHHDASHHVLSIEESLTYCTQSNSKVQFFIDEDDFASPYTTHVIVKVNVDHGGDGSFSTVGSQTWNLGDPD